MNTPKPSFAAGVNVPAKALRNDQCSAYRQDHDTRGFLLLNLILLTWLTDVGQVFAQDYTFTTLAGPVESGAGWFDGTGSEARFNWPLGVAVDIAGNLYVGDNGNSTIRKITPAGVVTTLAGLAGSWGSADGAGSEAQFCDVIGVAVDSTGNIYVADSGNYTIRKVTSTGLVTTLAGLAGTPGSADGAGSAARFDSPCGIALDSTGYLYVSEYHNHTIRKMSPAGEVVTLAGKAGSSGSLDGKGGAARFNSPYGVAVDREGYVYVGDRMNHTIRKVSPMGLVTTIAGQAEYPGSADGIGIAAQFNDPYGVALDSAGNVYVADISNATIRKITPVGVVTTLAGLARTWGSADGTGSAARFDSPCGIALDRSGVTFVSDNRNNTIRKMTPAGEVTTLAGRVGGAGTVDGTGSAARFDLIRSIAVDRAGNSYVAELDTIRKVTPAGVVTTLAGLAGSRGYVDGMGSAARFGGLGGVAVDGYFNVFVADTDINTIRKVTSAGEVTTLVGNAPWAGSVDGSGSNARFRNPAGVAVDRTGNLYIADTGNHTIRKVSEGRIVTTLAGQAGSSGSSDGNGSTARFNSPKGIAVDSAGNVYVRDSGNYTIRKVTSTGQVTTLAGYFDTQDGVAVDSAGNVYVPNGVTIRKIDPTGLVTTFAGKAGQLSANGTSDGTGSHALFAYACGVAVDGSGNVYVADAGSHSIRKGVPAAPDLPVIDLNLAPVDLPRQLDISNFTATAWSWSQVRRPSGSTAMLSSATARKPIFTPDVADLYVFRLKATNIAGSISIRTVELTATPATAVWLAVAGVESGGRLRMDLHGEVGKACEVWTALNLTNWSLLATITNLSGTVRFSDSMTNSPGRFYRLRQWIVD